MTAVLASMRQLRTSVLGQLVPTMMMFLVYDTFTSGSAELSVVVFKIGADPLLLLKLSYSPRTLKKWTKLRQLA